MSSTISRSGISVNEMAVYDVHVIINGDISFFVFLRYQKTNLNRSMKTSRVNSKSYSISV